MCPEGKTGTLVAGGNRYKLSERQALPTELPRAGRDYRGDELSVPDVCGSSSWGLQRRFLHWVRQPFSICFSVPSLPSNLSGAAGRMFHTTGGRKSISF